jgi:hypothetical protein
LDAAREEPAEASAYAIQAASGSNVSKARWVVVVVVVPGCRVLLLFSLFAFLKGNCLKVHFFS